MPDEPDVDPTDVPVGRTIIKANKSILLFILNRYVKRYVIVEIVFVVHDYIYVLSQLYIAVFVNCFSHGSDGGVGRA